MRWLLCVLFIVPLGCKKQSSTDIPPASPGLELQQEDYAQARSQFRTKLLHQGPSPQRSQRVNTPAGVKEIAYAPDMKLKAWVSPGEGKRPAVLFLHGGFAFGEDDWEMTKPFRDAGFVVMTPIFRGENGQPGSYTMFYDEVDDVVAAAESLAKLPYVDDKRIYVAGHSAGGTLSLLAALTSNRFKGAASFSGSPDQVAFIKGQEQLAPFDRNDIREFQMRSPVAYATSFKCPARLYYGSGEPEFGGFSRRTAMLAKEKGLDVEVVEVKGDHFSAVPEEIRQAIQFFQQK